MKIYPHFQQDINKISTDLSTGYQTMKKLFLAVCSMIVTGFLMKSYRKIREKPGEVYEDHLKIERRCADARATFNRMAAISTPMDGGPSSLIDTLMAPGRFM